MLLQEINFYRHFKPKKTSGSFLNWKRFWALNAIMVVFFFLIYAASMIEVIYLRSQDRSLQKELTSYQTKFDALKKTFPQLFFSDDIDESVDSLKHEIAAQEKIVDILTRRDPFSDNLIALSKTILPNVWLTRIQILKNGNEIILYGDSYGMQNIHSFINKLGENEIYSKYDIDIKSIKSSDKESNNAKINFELQMVRINE